MSHKYTIVWLTPDLEGYECLRCGYETVDPDDNSNCVYWKCDNCGEEYTELWYALEELWRKYAKGSKFDDTAGEFCIRCFDRMCKKDGYLIRWEVFIVTDKYK